MGRAETRAAVRHVWGASGTLLLMKVRGLAKEIPVAGVDLEVNFAEMVEPMSELKTW